MEPHPPGLIPQSEQWTDETLLWDQEDNRDRKFKTNDGVKVLKCGAAEGMILAANAGTLLLLAGTPDFPVVYGVDFGHTDPMMVLPNGVEACLNVTDTDKIDFSIVGSAVS